MHVDQGLTVSDDCLYNFIQEKTYTGSFLYFIFCSLQKKGEKNK